MPFLPGHHASLFRDGGTAARNTEAVPGDLIGLLAFGDEGEIERDRLRTGTREGNGLQTRGVRR